MNNFECVSDYVETHDGKVTVCRDFAKGKCTRVMCKYYHVPVLSGSLLQLLSPQSAALAQLQVQAPDPTASALAFLTQPTGMEQAALLFAGQPSPSQNPFAVVSTQSCNG